MCSSKIRCAWAADTNDVYYQYHDEEWGVPIHDDRKLFELLILEGAQAGLSWITVLQKRENYRNALDNFDYEKIALYDEKKLETLLQDPGIIRNKLKVQSLVKNARAFIGIQQEFGSFDAYIWSYVNNIPIQNVIHSMEEMLAKTELSDKIAKDLKKRGMNFVGSTIIYAFMQAIGLVNDHEEQCFRNKDLL